jgi:hypothetical protein
MPIVGEEKKKYMRGYNPRYYEENKEHLLEYRKGRREKDRETLKRWRRKKKISSGSIYKTKTSLNPYS